MRNKFCKLCGKKYKFSYNEAYKEGSYELRYINEDDNARYFSNKYLGYCPSCVKTGIKNESEN